jgi:hypothetical protein
LFTGQDKRSKDELIEEYKNKIAAQQKKYDEELKTM